MIHDILEIRFYILDISIFFFDGSVPTESKNYWKTSRLHHKKEAPPIYIYFYRVRYLVADDWLKVTAGDLPSVQIHQNT